MDTHTKKILANVAIFVGVTLLLAAIGSAQDPLIPQRNVLFMLAAGLIIGISGALVRHWQRSKDDYEPTEDLELIAKAYKETDSTNLKEK